VKQGNPGEPTAENAGGNVRPVTLISLAIVIPLALLAGIMLTYCAVSPPNAAAPPLGTAAAVDTPVETKEEFASDESFKEAAAQWNKRLTPEFKFTVCKPFLVVGDLTENDLNRFARNTVRDCAEAYYKMYFSKKPRKVLTVFLFNGDESYRKWAKALFGDTDVSKYGYYSSVNSALVMNIGTGGGTLVHEMFHALVEADFDEIPAWANEGIASLYEQCDIKQDRLVGLVNWRLPGLQEGMEKKYVPLRTLFSMNREDFYAGYKSGMHYAEARYFCMWLQEKALLEKFYKEFRDRRSEDPTGIKFLEEVLGVKVEEAETEWKKWVDTLEWN
jgi:hypothetical protein